MKRKLERQREEITERKKEERRKELEEATKWLEGCGERMARMREVGGGIKSG